MHVSLLKKTLLVMLISACVTPKADAFFGNITNKQKIFAAIAAVVAPGAWNYFTKKESLKRYSFEDLNQDGKSALKNLIYFYYDFVWGTPPQYDSIKLKTDTGELSWEVRAKKPGDGIVGTIHTNFKTITAVAGLLTVCYCALDADAYDKKEGLFHTILKYLLDPKAFPNKALEKVF